MLSEEDCEIDKDEPELGFDLFNGKIRFVLVTLTLIQFLLAGRLVELRVKMSFIV